MKFSRRTSWNTQRNSISRLIELKKSAGVSICDLTATNPTLSGLIYPEQEILSSLADRNGLLYTPDSRGLFSAREAISTYYHSTGVNVPPKNLVLTASTSEAYSHVFTVLCNPGETVLVPRPSYPLFDYLAQIHDVRLKEYRLFYDYGWHLDVESVKASIDSSTKAIVIVNPHNPTGMFLTPAGYDSLKRIAASNNLALIVDEVFIEFGFDERRTIVRTAGESDILTLTLNGISKMCGLPQMKLGWITTSGSASVVQEFIERLETIADTFLSVNTPVQTALTALFQSGTSIREQILQRCKANYHTAHALIAGTSSSRCSVLLTEGGWCCVLQAPSFKSDEEWACELLEHCNALVHPGYFYDFESGEYLILSLLTEEQSFAEGIRRVVQYIDKNA